MSNSLVITQPDDWHVHFRSGKTLEKVALLTAKVFGRALVMPNTAPPILTGEDANRYRYDIYDILGATSINSTFEPLTTIKLTMDTTAEMIYEAALCGVTAVKLYPTGVTTNSQDGVDLDKLTQLAGASVFHAIADTGMVLCVHGESPGEEVLRREGAVIPHIVWLLREFTRLKIVVEHVSTKAMSDFVANDATGRLAATVTAHHLYLTLDDLLGGELQPHYFCKPVVKQLEDQAALWRHVQNCGNFFFGSDSAPHDVSRKHCSSCAAGVFTAPILLPLLADMFEAHGILDCLEAFVSQRGARFYNVPFNRAHTTLVKSDKPIVMADRLVFGVENEQVIMPMPLRPGHKQYWRVVS